MELPWMNFLKLDRRPLLSPEHSSISECFRLVRAGQGLRASFGCWEALRILSLILLRVTCKTGKKEDKTEDHTQGTENKTAQRKKLTQEEITPISNDLEKSNFSHGFSHIGNMNHTFNGFEWVMVLCSVFKSATLQPRALATDIWIYSRHHILQHGSSFSWSTSLVKHSLLQVHYYFPHTKEFGMGTHLFTRKSVWFLNTRLKIKPSSVFKQIVHPKNYILLLFIHPHAITSLNYFLLWNIRRDILKIRRYLSTVYSFLGELYLKTCLKFGKMSISF